MTEKTVSSDDGKDQGGKSDSPEYSCELSMLAGRLFVLEGLLFSYRDSAPAGFEADEKFLHGLGYHLQSIGLELERINTGLYGNNTSSPASLVAGCIKERGAA